jgi:hypothetical protein
MAKRRMAEIMCKCGGLYDIGKIRRETRITFAFLQDSLCNAASYLSNFEGVGKAVMKYISMLGRNDLRDFCKPSELG